MNLKILLVSIIIIGSSLAYSGTESQLFAENVSYFDQLSEYFAKADVPTLDELSGWHSGRCYQNLKPNQPRAALAVLVEENGGNDDGPLFPNVKYIYPFDYTTPSQFDSYTSDVEALVQSTLNSGIEITPAEVVDGSYISKYEFGNLVYRVRKGKDYLFMIHTVIKDLYPFKAGDIFAACYLFKKIHD